MSYAQKLSVRNTGEHNPRSTAHPCLPAHPVSSPHVSGNKASRRGTGMEAFLVWWFPGGGPFGSLVHISSTRKGAESYAKSLIGKFDIRKIRRVTK